MKNFFKSLCLFLAIMVLLDSFYNTKSVSAKTYALSKKYEKQYLFAVPEGGWSSIAVTLDYCERYTKSSATVNEFYRREYVFCYKCAYATSKPGGKVSTIKHSSKSGDVTFNFTTWDNFAVIVPTGYDFVTSKENKQTRCFSPTTDSYAHISFLVSCNDAVPAIQTGGFKLNLNTK